MNFSSTSHLIKIVLLSLLMSSLFFASVTQADEPLPPSRKPASALKFDDSVIEGVEKKPLSSIDMIGNRGKDGKLHTLYKKRVDFDDKNPMLFQQLRNSP